jgi:hypothetical protein
MNQSLTTVQFESHILITSTPEDILYHTPPEEVSKTEPEKPENESNKVNYYEPYEPQDWNITHW